MIEFTVVSGDLDRALDAWDGWWGGQRPVKIVGDELARDGSERIAKSDRAPTGERWKRWSKDYADTRGPEHKLLVSSGSLRDSLEARQRGDTVEVGSELPYALVHQEGSKDGRIPARPYIGVTRKLERTVSRLISDDFETAFGRFR